jgi:hypothetical protein
MWLDTRTLVEEQDLGIVGDRLGQLHPLAHALAVAAELAVLRAEQVHLVEGVLGPVAALGLVVSRQAQQRHQELEPRQALPEGVDLGTQAHPVEQLRRRP